jgi:hypothetical protein
MSNHSISSPTSFAPFVGDKLKSVPSMPDYMTRNSLRI